MDFAVFHRLSRIDLVGGVAGADKQMLALLVF